MWLRATTACNFSSLLWPAGSAPAALASLLFDPPEPQIIGKTQRIATPTFSRISIFFLLTLSLLLFSLLISLLSASALLLCFSSVHIVGSLTSKLPSPMIEYDVNNIRLLFDIYEVDKVSSARLLHQHQKLLHSPARTLLRMCSIVIHYVAVLPCDHHWLLWAALYRAVRSLHKSKREVHGLD